MPSTIAEKIRLGAAVIDVRSPLEFSGGSYPGARNIPVGDLPGRIAEIGPKDQAVVVFCRSGTRSATAREHLLAQGWKDVTNAGGLDDLLAALD